MRTAGPHILGRHQRRIVAKCPKLATEMMRANAAVRQAACWRVELPPGHVTLLTQYNRVLPIDRVRVSHPKPARQPGVRSFRPSDQSLPNRTLLSHPDKHSFA